MSVTVYVAINDDGTPFMTVINMNAENPKEVLLQAVKILEEENNLKINSDNESIVN
jgi:hypothetical protein